MYEHWLKDVYVKAKLSSLGKQIGHRLLPPEIAGAAEPSLEEK